MVNFVETFEQVIGFIEDQNLAKARLYLERIEGNIPDDGPFQKIIGQLYQCIGDDEKSLTYILRAKELLPEDRSLLMNLGYHYLDNGDPKLAANYFEKCLITETPTARALCYLGRAYD